MNTLRRSQAFLSAVAPSITISQKFSSLRPSMCDKPEEKVSVRRSTRKISKTTKTSTSTGPDHSKKKLKPKLKAEVQWCSWVGSAPDYVEYHDKEWGVPLYDDNKMFEFLFLETFQAGLSWLTILRKRENFRRLFYGFDVDAIAKMTEQDVDRLVQDPSIIRHIGKIRAAIVNAKGVIYMRDVENVKLADYFWKWVDYKQIINTSGELQSRSELSDSIAKDLKKRGFKFIGSTVIYAHLQAIGIINDHHPSCARFEEVKQLVRAKDDINPTNRDV